MGLFVGPQYLSSYFFMVGLRVAPQSTYYLIVGPQINAADY